MSLSHLTIIQDALSETLERSVPEVTAEMRIDRDFDLDSVMFVQFLLALEDRVPGLRFDPEALTEASFNSVGALVDFLVAFDAQAEVA